MLFEAQIVQDYEYVPADTAGVETGYERGLVGFLSRPGMIAQDDRNAGTFELTVSDTDGVVLLRRDGAQAAYVHPVTRAIEKCATINVTTAGETVALVWDDVDRYALAAATAFGTAVRLAVDTRIPCTLTRIDPSP